MGGSQRGSGGCHRSTKVRIACVACALAATDCGKDAPEVALGSGRYHGVFAFSTPLFVDGEIGVEQVWQNGTTQPAYAKMTLDLDPFTSCGGVPDTCVYYDGNYDKGSFSGGLTSPGVSRSTVFTASGQSSGGAIMGTLSWWGGSGAFVLIPSAFSPPERRCGKFTGDDDGTFVVSAVRDRAAVAAWTSYTTNTSSLLRGAWSTAKGTRVDRIDDVQHPLSLDGTVSLQGGMYSQMARVGVGLGTGTWSSPSGAKGTWKVDSCKASDAPGAGGADAASDAGR